MKKTVAVILAVIILTGCLSGCGRQEEAVEVSVASTETSGVVSVDVADITLMPADSPSPTETPHTDEPSPAPTPAPTQRPETSGPNAGSTQNSRTQGATPSPTPKPTATPKPTQEPIEDLNYIPGYVNCNGVNMREAPSTSSNVIAEYSTGKNLYITGRNSDWYRVRVDSKTGFIAKRFISLGVYATPSPTPKPTPKPTATPKPTNTPKPTATPTPKPTNTAAPSGYYTVSPGEFSESDIMLVAKLLKKEANSGSTDGLRAIASVVLNRVKNESNHFPNTVPGVIYQHNQFYPEGALDNVTPGSNHIAAARYVFSEHGATLPKKVLFYKASYLGTSWYSYLQYYCTIDDNNFFIAISNGY